MATLRGFERKDGAVECIRRAVETASEDPLSHTEILINELLDRIEELEGSNG